MTQEHRSRSAASVALGERARGRRARNGSLARVRIPVFHAAVASKNFCPFQSRMVSRAAVIRAKPDIDHARSPSRR